jgi:hypothetical protein
MVAKDNDPNWYEPVIIVPIADLQEKFEPVHIEPIVLEIETFVEL